MVDSLICGQVTQVTWTTKDVEYFLAAPSLALAEMNLISASYTLTPHGNLSFDPNVGATGGGNQSGGNTAYMDTGYTPTSGQMTVTSASLSVCVETRGILTPNIMHLI